MDKELKGHIVRLLQDTIPAMIVSTWVCVLVTGFMWALTKIFPG